MQKYLILFLCLSIFPILSAQEEVDTTDQKECGSLNDLIWIKDTVYKVFKTHRFSNLRVVYPSYKTYKRFIDTSLAGSQSEITKYYMYNGVWNSLRMQFSKLMLKSQKAGIDWNKTVLDSFYIDTGFAGDYPFVYIHWIVKYNNKRRYHYSGLFLFMFGKWYLMDELRFGGIIVEKKKKKLKLQKLKQLKR